jgi:hypothetical protein
VLPATMSGTCLEGTCLEGTIHCLRFDGQLQLAMKSEVETSTRRRGDREMGDRMSNVW